MDFKKMVKNGYDAIAERYLTDRKRDSEDVRLLGELVRRLPAGARVLDAGCGAGIPVTRILSKTFVVTGVDFSESQIELAKRNVPDATFLCRDMTALDFADETFDAVCSYYAIIHIPRQEHFQLLMDFQRMLRPGGLALLCLGMENLVDDIEEDYLGAPMYWSHYDSVTYLSMLEECNFQIIWSKRVADASCPGSGHLFVLVQKEPRI